MNYKVLIVDDHDVSLLLQQILWKNKFNIIPDQARCGEDAIDKAEHQDYDFIIVDFEMYGMRGDQLVKKLRGMEKYKNTPIIVLSSRIDSDAVDTCMLSGADDYLMKPIVEDIYFSRINDLSNLNIVSSTYSA